LSVAAKERSEEELLTMLGFAVGSTVKKFKVDNNLSDEEIAECSESIYDEYYWYNIEDIKLCCEMVIRGRFGKVYNRVDIPMVLGWFEQYDQLRTSNWAEKRDGAHAETKDSSPRQRSDENKVSRLAAVFGGLKDFFRP